MQILRRFLVSNICDLSDTSYCYGLFGVNLALTPWTKRAVTSHKVTSISVCIREDPKWQPQIGSAFCSGRDTEIKIITPFKPKISITINFRTFLATCATYTYGQIRKSNYFRFATAIWWLRLEDDAARGDWRFTRVDRPKNRGMA